MQTNEIFGSDVRKATHVLPACSALRYECNAGRPFWASNVRWTAGPARRKPMATREPSILIAPHRLWYVAIKMVFLFSSIDALSNYSGIVPRMLFVSKCYQENSFLLRFNRLHLKVRFPRQSANCH